MLEQENRWLLARISSPCVSDVETYFYLLIDLYNISVIDRSPSPGDNILQPTGKHSKRIPRARYPGYQRFFLCLGMLRCRSQCRSIFGQRPKQRVAMKTYDRNRKPRTLEKSLAPRIRARTITKISLTSNSVFPCCQFLFMKLIQRQLLFIFLVILNVLSPNI